MNLRLLAVLGGFTATAASANDAFFKAEVVDAAAPGKLPNSPADSVWKEIAGRNFRITPQRSVRLNDRRSNEVLQAGPASTEVMVKAAASAQELVVYLEWKDPAKEVVRADEVNVYADSVAVQVPVAFGRGLRLPAIGMGDDQSHVAVSMLRATKSGALASRFSAAGFGSLTRQASATDAPALMQYDEAQKLWRALFILPLDADSRGLVPVALAVWDGARGERSGYKRLSSWHFVRLPKQQVDPTWIKELAFGYYPGDLGDVGRGRQLAEAVCVSCHHLPGKLVAPSGLAPSLETIGAVASAGYLRDSVIAPSAVILHALNPNQHYLPGGPKDKNGAFPNSDSFRWSIKGPDGKWVSKMPPFAGFPPAQLADLLAYLKSLDGLPEEKR